MADAVVSWAKRDCSLYALAVGVGFDAPTFVVDGGSEQPLHVLPTFPTSIVGPLGIGLFHQDDTHIWKMRSRDAHEPLLAFDETQLLHVSEEIRCQRPLQPEGRAIVTSQIEGIRSSARATHFSVHSRGFDEETHEELFSLRAGLVARMKCLPLPASRKIQRPESHSLPDVTRQYPTRADQPLLYRAAALSGGQSRIHSDPGFSVQAGYRGPLLHGLYIFGLVGRLLLDEVCKSDRTLFRTMFAKFVAPVTAGDVLTVSVWRQGSGTEFEVTTGVDKAAALGRFSCGDHGDRGDLR